MKKSLISRLKAVFIPNLLAVGVIALLIYLKAFDSGSFTFSVFVIVPILMGILGIWYLRHEDLTASGAFTYALYIWLVSLACSAIFLGEGTICLIIVSPLLLAFVSLGVFLGREAFKRNRQRLNISVVMLLLLVFVVDSLSKHHYENVVGDTMVINASTEEVWKHVVAFEKIKRKENYWLFRIGMPSPSETTVTGYCKGAGRKCIFSNGYVFDEVISTYEPARDLTFDITGQPRDPEIMGHIDVLRGQFLLKGNHDGTTTLTGNSWYRLYVFPSWYYDLWARNIVRNVHYRVMEHIRDLSEKN